MLLIDVSTASYLRACESMKKVVLQVWWSCGSCIYCMFFIAFGVNASSRLPLRSQTKSSYERWVPNWLRRVSRTLSGWSIPRWSLQLLPQDPLRSQCSNLISGNLNFSNRLASRDRMINKSNWLFVFTYNSRSIFFEYDFIIAMHSLITYLK